MTLVTVEQLVRAAGGGDEGAFARLVRLHEKKVYNLALRICGNPEDAADAAQEAFLAAWRGLPDFRGESGFATWLYRLARNAAIDQLRRSRRRLEGNSLELEAWGLDPADPAPSPQARAEGKELREAVLAGLERLGGERRRILALRELEELSYEEIAAALDLEPGTVKSRISRARAALRKILLEDGNLSGYLPSKASEGPGKGGSQS